MHIRKISNNHLAALDIGIIYLMKYQSDRQFLTISY
jgi:hypothetical protein